MKEKQIGGLLWKFKGSDTKIKEEKEKKYKKVVGTKPKIRWLHASPKNEGTTKTIQMPP